MHLPTITSTKNNTHHSQSRIISVFFISIQPLIYNYHSYKNTTKEHIIITVHFLLLLNNVRSPLCLFIAAISLAT